MKLQHAAEVEINPHLRKKDKQMQRIYSFLPSVLTLACIAGATSLYLKLIVKYFGDNLKSVEWCKKNKWKVVWTIGTPLSNVRVPAVEELIFRAPLIIAFSAMSSTAWYGIFVSSGLFALIHWFGKKIWLQDVFFAQEKGNHKTDNMEAELSRLHQEKGKEIMVRKVLHVVFALLLGILAGYYGIKYQSVWVSFYIHSAWNLIMPMVVLLLLSLVMLVFFGISSLYHRLWMW